MAQQDKKIRKWAKDPKNKEKYPGLAKAILEEVGKKPKPKK